jgi:hypothetical protein
MITLQGAHGSITLDNPKFGDTNTLVLNRILRETRGNDLVMKNVPGWTGTELMRWEWDYLTDQKLRTLRHFFEAHIGLVVQTTDHYGVVRNVLFLKPDAEFSQIGFDNRTFTLDMQVLL